MIKIGDIVRVNHPKEAIIPKAGEIVRLLGDINSSIRKGCSGTVVKVSCTSSSVIEIKINGRSVFVCRDDVEIVSESKFKVGDYVKTNGSKLTMYAKVIRVDLFEMYVLEYITKFRQTAHEDELTLIQRSASS
jgi:hypothetical protein